MRKAISFFIMIGVLAMVVSCDRTPEGQGAPQTMQRSVGLSAKLGTPVPASVESCMALTGNSGRDRGWCLFNYLTANGNDPIWTDWTAIPNEGVGKMDCGRGAPRLALTRSQEESLAPIFQAKPEMKVLRRLAPPAQAFRSKQGPKGAFGIELLHDPNLAVFKQSEPKSNAAAAVIYNDALKDAVCEVRGTDPLNVALSSPGAASKFPLRGDNGVYIAVKTVWAVVPDSRPAPLPWFTVWDNQSPDLVSGKGVQDWGSTLQVDDSQPAPACGFADLDSPQWPMGQNPKTISPRCFHSFSLNKEQLHTVMGSFTPNQTVQPNSSGTAAMTYLILLGFHVIAKVPGGNWTWQTFWWSAAATTSESRFHLGNGTPKPGEWGNYVMMTEEEGMSADRSAFNPYLEAPLPRGGYSDCVTCHARARYYSATQALPNPPQEYFNSALNCALSVPSRIPCDEFPPGLDTDKLWSLADSNLANLGHGDGANSQ